MDGGLGHHRLLLYPLGVDIRGLASVGDDIIFPEESYFRYRGRCVVIDGWPCTLQAANEVFTSCSEVS